MKAVFNLQEGFKNDKVIISSDDKKIYEAEDVSTRTQIGLATSFELEFSKENPLVKIEIPNRGITGEKKIDLSKGSNVGISIGENEQLEWKISEQPFMYM